MLQEAQRYNKAIAAALVTIVGWVAYEWGGVDVPDAVSGALTTLLVYAVPNREE